MGAKLVRDKTQETAEALGVSGHWYKASPEEIVPALTRKLMEEAFEFAENGDVSELWDVYDVIHALFERLDPHKESLNAHTDKTVRLGRFDDGIMWNPVPCPES